MRLFESMSVSIFDGVCMALNRGRGTLWCFLAAYSSLVIPKAVEKIAEDFADRV